MKILTRMLAVATLIGTAMPAGTALAGEAQGARTAVLSTLAPKHEPAHAFAWQGPVTATENRILSYSFGLLASNEYFLALTRASCSSTRGRALPGAVPFTTDAAGTALIVPGPHLFDRAEGDALQAAVSFVIYPAEPNTERHRWSACGTLDKHLVKPVGAIPADAAPELVGALRPGTDPDAHGVTSVWDDADITYLRGSVGGLDPDTVYRLGLSRASCGSGQGRIARRPVKFTTDGAGSAALSAFIDGLYRDIWNGAAHRASSLVVTTGGGGDLVSFVACGTAYKLQLEDVLVSS
jgi:hypothetical protein